MQFFGRYDVNIDAKGRLQVPAKYRQMWESAGERTWISVPWGGTSIRLYPATTFQAISSGLGTQLFPDETTARVERDFLGSVESIEPDGAGRIIIPSWQVKEANLASEVVVVGVGNRLEVWDRSAWNSDKERTARLPALVQQMGQHMSRRPQS